MREGVQVLWYDAHVGDEHGRKKVLIITIVLMGASSLGIGLLPTYASIGYAAPIGLLVLRLLQGLALGGELPSTYVYISESMPQKRGSGFGITMTGVNAGLLLGMAINQLLNLSFNTEQLTAYGWRIPFIIGGALVYRQALRIADKMYITRIHHEFPDATSFFPVVNWDLWEETEREEYPADEKNPYPYTYITYVRKK